MTGHAWHQYWSWTGGNIGAMPLEALITAAASLALWPLLRRWWRRLKRELGAAAHEEAKAARQIAADLFQHHTGQRHPAAPDREDEGQ